MLDWDDMPTQSGLRILVMSCERDVWLRFDVTLEDGSKTVKINGPLRSMALAVEVPFAFGPVVGRQRMGPSGRTYTTHDSPEAVGETLENWPDFAGSWLYVPLPAWQDDTSAPWFAVGGEAFFSESAAQEAK